MKELQELVEKIATKTAERHQIKYQKKPSGWWYAKDQELQET